MKELKVENLKKTYGEKDLFNHLTFSIQEKDRIGLIGVNGTGKSSLLNILSQREGADGDVSPISMAKDYRIAYLAQQHDFSDDESVAEAVFSGETAEIMAVKNYELSLLALEEDSMSETAQNRFSKCEEEMNKLDAWNLEARAKSILNKLGVDFLSKKIGELSGGQQKRVQLANTLLSEADLLLLDEPTNHLDYQTIEWLENYLQNFQGAILLVTHDRYFLDAVANRIFELEFGNLVEYKGNYQDYLAQKEVRIEEAKNQEYKRKQLFKQELAWMRKGVEARRTKQQARINRFHDLKENLHQVKINDDVEMNFASKRLGKKVLELSKASLSIGENVLLREFDLLVQANARIGITGKNGAGKSTLLNVLSERLNIDSGTLEVGETVRIAFYTQQNEDLPNDKRMIRYLQSVAEEVKTANGETIGVAEMLERFLFPRHSHGTLIGKLSGGEKRRLYLLKLLMEQPNVLLLDEPTNDLDISTLTVLEDYLAQFSGAVIAVSHDRYFLDKTMNQLLIFEGNGKIERFYGNMTDYLDKKESEELLNLPNKKIESKEVKKEKIKEKKRLSYMEQKEWATIEDEISSLEERIEEIDMEMNEHGSDFGKLNLLQKELDEITKQLEEKYERWEYLSEYV
ncbi:ATP-binding cassette, subfamily F, uup [Pilibacter termitis]|uniref:ATP-binding cassette, subfamily F, uup n=1 Tax=Pilibacter termitis TaxID=263852 RepID=A0A1T4NJ01_9ENTE|nr:ABC-F family ATP-binding cassette domain-containing protein [Pilibacter termitis]SJZ79301.1 ATP-binding cassette, subfamily F, uup [Pilibacter termitis]